MSFTLHAAAQPMFLRGLASLDHLIDKAMTSDLEEAEVMDARLAADMRPFPDQIRMASFSARGAMARLAGVDWPKTDDSEASLAELKATVALSRDFVASLDAASFEGAGARPITLQVPGVELNFVGEGYLTSFALPNFYFHLTTAYAILRHKGVELGKRDFLGQLALV